MSISTLKFEPSLCGQIRKLTEELTEEDVALQRFFDLSPDMFCIADFGGNLHRVNKAWTEMLGWEEEELLNVPFLDFVHPNDLERTLNVMSKMEKEHTIRFHNRYRQKGTDKYVVLEWSATAWTNGYTYAAARIVPDRCLVCPDAEERFGLSLEAMKTPPIPNSKPKSK